MNIRYIYLCIFINIYVRYIFMYLCIYLDGEMERKCWDLLLEEHCEKLFCLMDSFWEVIVGANVNLNWLIKIRSHLDKI